MQVIHTTFLAESITTRSNIFVKFGKSQGIEDQKTLSSFTKLGRVNSESIKGWLRYNLEQMLLEYGVSPCHCLPRNVMTAERNKIAYEKDLALGYHERASCVDKGKCLVLKLYGTLDMPGNLIIPSCYYYPANNGAITKNHNKLFGSIGIGRTEIVNSSPRVRHNGHQPYLTTEKIVGTAIQAPLKLILRKKDEKQHVLLIKLLEYIHGKLTGDNYSFENMLGGGRTNGHGRCVLVFLNESGNYITKNRNVLGMKKEKAEEINKKFKEIIKEEREKFPIKKRDLTVEV